MGGGSKIDGSLLAGYDTGGPSQHVLLIANASRLEPKLRASAARSNANLTFQSVESLDQVTCDDLERTMAVVVCRMDTCYPVPALSCVIIRCCQTSEGGGAEAGDRAGDRCLLLITALILWRCCVVLLCTDR